VRRIRGIALAVVLLSATFPATRVSARGQTSTLSISADSLTVDLKAHSAVYRGNVAAHDPAHGVTILADRIRFVLDPGMDAVEYARASGAVRLTYGAARAVADHVEYFPSDTRVLLTGNPEVWQNSQIVTGCRITLLLRQDRSRVESCSGDRVHTIFYPGRTAVAASIPGGAGKAAAGSSLGPGIPRRGASGRGLSAGVPPANGAARSPSPG